MRNIDQYTITEAVLASFEDCTDPRLKAIVGSLTRHLHDFARETHLTEAEWFEGIRFLTRVGKITDDQRQEFILLSDVLGLSMLVTAQNNVRPHGCTEATVFGPFYVQGVPTLPLGADIAAGASGMPCFVSGTVRSLDGAPVAHAQIDVWQSDDQGMYDVQYAFLDGYQARARLESRADGSFDFRSVRPVPYPIPHDGPVGDLLHATGRHPWRPAHLHFMITAEGHERLITHVFDRRSDYLDSDAVFGVRSSLVADWVIHAAGPAPDGTVSSAPYATLAYDFVLHRVRSSA